MPQYDYTQEGGGGQTDSLLNSEVLPYTKKK